MTTDRLYDVRTKSGLESLARDLYWVSVDQCATFPALDDPTYVQALATAREWHACGLDDAAMHDRLVALAGVRNRIEDEDAVPLATAPPARVVDVYHGKRHMKSTKSGLTGELLRFAMLCGFDTKGETL